MDAIDAGDTLRLDPVRDALVGGEHELFDQTMRPAPLRAHDGLHVPFGIELHDRLRKIEVDGATALALGVEFECEFVHSLELGN